MILWLESKSTSVKNWWCAILLETLAPSYLSWEKRDYKNLIFFICRWNVFDIGVVKIYFTGFFYCWVIARNKKSLNINKRKQNQYLSLNAALGSWLERIESNIRYFPFTFWWRLLLYVLSSCSVFLYRQDNISMLLEDIHYQRLR